MKNDPTFKFLAAIIVAGVIVAFASPSPTSTENAPVADVAHATAASATE